VSIDNPSAGALNQRGPEAGLRSASPRKDANRLNREPARPQFSAGMRMVVTLVLIACFSGMLLATYQYVSNRRTTVQSSAQSDAVAGSEARALTDVNLRMDSSLAGPVVGVVERGSLVKILSVKNNSYEVMILEHGRPKEDPSSQDRGWMNKRFLKFDE
jgi:hypothetical protein